MSAGREGSSFHLAGDLEPWMGILLAVAVAALAWWLYWLEVGKGKSTPLSKALPLLRAAAVALIVLTMVGPTIRKVSEEGQRGRVLVFLDGSKSMSIKDDHMSAGRKLLLAERHGWLPKDQKLLDPALHDAADLLAEARINLEEGLDDPAANLKKLAQSFAGKTERAAQLLEGKNYEVPANIDRKGVLHHEVWEGIGGSSVSDLTNHARFREGKPSSSSFVEATESPMNVGDNFGRRIWAKLVPPETGKYLFWVYSDDECIVRLNDAGRNPKDARNILRHSGSTERAWNERRVSQPITLNQSKVYYFEILHKEGGGNDFCAVGWTLPSGRLERPIPGKHFVIGMFGSLTFSEVRESMRAEVVKTAKKLNEGEGEATETAMRDVLSGLAETTLSYENRFRSTFELYAENLANSDDESVRSAIADFDSKGRWERASLLLTEREDSILRKLADTHVIEVRSLTGPEATRLWDNGTDTEPPKGFGSNAETRRTDLASGLQTTVKGEIDDEKTRKGQAGEQPRSAAVILSDGLHNQGASPIETAKLLAGRDLPVHTIGFGSDIPPLDLAVLEVEAPSKVLKDDRVRGSVTIKDNLRAGTAFKIMVEDGQGEVVWEKDYAGMNSKHRRVDFDFSIEKLVEEKIAALGLGESVEVNALPFRMKVRVEVESVESEARTDNNALSFSFDAITKKNSMLIIDGRPRWETRYLRNLFERDERWSSTTAFAGPAANENSLPRGEEGDVFPSDKKTLFAYDLLVFGEISPDLFEDEELEWIHDFVAHRGGGILLLDGPRQKFREYAEDEENPITSLLPVKWLEEGPKRLSPHAFRLTERGSSASALFLHPSAERNAELWGYLPKPGWVAPTEALPGTEVYLEATLDKEGDNAAPVLVSRSVGAGRVLYAGFDGTWRWRFEVGDKYHQRYWHQLAAWIMEQPFAVSDEFLSIDPGASTYRPGETANLRVRVRDREGKPLTDDGVEVEALVWRDGKIIATVPLESNASESGGLFRGETPALSAGEHEVTMRVNGLYEENELRSKVEFLVREPESPELATLTCNEDLLRKVAELSGGRYLREEQIGRLNELLKPISSGKLVTMEIALWQSYWWFIPIVLLLGVELFLRKRAGML